MEHGLSERLATLTRGRAGALALVTPEQTTYAHHGCSPDAEFEIGSISKGVTGLLYHVGLERGEISATTRLGELLPLTGSAAGGIVLADLATHRSGLPRILGAHLWRRTLDHYRHGTNPYSASVEDLVEAALSARLRPGHPAYSNAGFQLLGHALGAAARLTYADLVRIRVAEPLGLASFDVPASAADLPPSAVAGYAGRRQVDPWLGASIGPAGGIRASVESMAALAEALLAGTAPGAAALNPVADFAGPAVRIGAGWLTTNRRGRGVLTWHNGGTGGFRSWLGLRRDLGLAVVVLGASDRSVDALGLTLLDEIAGQGVPGH